MDEIIQPRVLKGFRDFLPAAEIERARMSETLVRVFRSFGFVPIDTPVLEYAEILLGKSGGDTEKQIYRFKDHGDRDVALRFDLTVPFARFMAEHAGELYLPFKRYHIAKAWRGENTQRGRYREFVQCDFDVVGVDCASADFEIIQTICDSMRALETGGFKVRFNHRGIFNRFLERIGAREKSVEILRGVDKLDKVGKDAVRKTLEETLDSSAAGAVLDFIERGENNADTLAHITSMAGGENPDSQRLESLLSCARETGIEPHLVIDPSITRGLDYYTGVVFETYLDALGEIGSVCSGGRYNDLASLYTKQHLPGVGAAIGLDRLLAALEALGQTTVQNGYSRAIIFCTEENALEQYWKLSSELRSHGIACEIFPEKKKNAQQYSYAEKKNIPWGITLGTDETGHIIMTAKNLGNRESTDFSDSASLAAFLDTAQ